MDKGMNARIWEAGQRKAMNRAILILAVLGFSLGLADGCAVSGPTPAEDSSTAPPASASAPVENDPVPVASSQHPDGSERSSAAQEAAAPQAVYPRGAEEYRIGPQDLLDIQIFGADELNRTVRVNFAGYVSLPLVGLVKAAGLTSEQLEQRLAADFARQYLKNPQVSVFVKEYISQRVTVEGAVKKPGVFPLAGRTTLLQALALAEGLTALADPGSVKLFRTEPGGTKETLTFDLVKIRHGEIIDPVIKGDDIVQVGESAVKSVAQDIIQFLVPFHWWVVW
jgi:polysaccharide export outer membrane protein